MTDSMNFGPDWIRNLSSEGTTGGGTSGGTRYQLADHRYGREEMLALFDKGMKPPSFLTTFKPLYSEPALVPLALLPSTDEERNWQSRPTTTGGPPRGRGGSLERGGRISRGRGSYQPYGRTSTYDSGWGNGEQLEWSPRKEFNPRTTMADNWRRVRSNDEDDGWRNNSQNRPAHEKWGRSASWRGESESEDRNGPDRGNRSTWHDISRGPPSRRSWDNEDHLPEWATENPTEGGGTFDERGAFHGSDDEQLDNNNKSANNSNNNNNNNNKKETILQKSTSQQHITIKTYHPPLSSSKSAISLNKSEEIDKEDFVNNESTDEFQSLKENGTLERDKIEAKIPEKIDKIENFNQDDMHGKFNEKLPDGNGPMLQESINTIATDPVEEDFERFQEDLVLKLVDEEKPKTIQQQLPSASTTVSSSSSSVTTNFDLNNIQPPPNLNVPQTIPQHDKWFYQDPQGTRQGPFLNVEMAEWYKAGYFSNQLNVMRECDERYFLLGELINLCGGDNPFLSNIRFPILKNETTKLSDDVLSYQYLTQLAFKQQVPVRTLTEPWSALTLQQRELAAQRLLLQQQQQQQQQVPQDLQYLQQSSPPNPLLYMINQMQQNNKLPGTVLVDKPNNTVPNQLDPLLMQMGNLHSLQNRIQTTNLHNRLTNLPPPPPQPAPPQPQQQQQQQDNLTNNLSSLANLSNLHSGLPAGLQPTSINRSNDQLIASQPPSQQQDNDALSSFLKQFQQLKQRSQQMDSLWQKQNQFTTSNTTTQWPQQQQSQPPHLLQQQQQQQQQPDIPLTMWDIQPSSAISPITVDNGQVLSSIAATSAITTITDKVKQQQQQQQQKEEKDQQHHPKEELTQKELKKKKEHEEKQAKKDAEERRKQEQRKQELDKKASEEKRKKEEEKVRKELEKAKREAEEKRLRELEEKRRLKEQRKAEEEARKKSDETKRQEEEKMRREIKEKDERKLNELSNRIVVQNHTIRTSKTAPWCQSNSTLGMSLTDIQKAEKEKRAQEVALSLQKQQQLQEQQQQQQQLEKSSGGIQLNWAKKPMETRKVKSVAEIQAEEHERLAKLAAEARLAAQQKEKEMPSVQNTGNIWNGQSLTWASASSTSSSSLQQQQQQQQQQQWSSNAVGGFWDDTSSKSLIKPSTIPKSSSTSAMTNTLKQQQQQQQKQTKSKPSKKEETQLKSSNNNNNNNPIVDEFTNWCYKTLSNISTNVDIPTFVTFLRDIESAFDVREYCKDYLGDSPAMQQFASNFLEKRRSFKPKNYDHKDDMCSPAPAITPSMQHSSEFQEVKGKNKKNKKSKMLKVDSRILGFNVTSAPDRINVGDRYYGDNS